MNLRRCKKGHFYNAEQFLKCPYCAGIMEFKGDNDNDDDDEDTVNPFIDEELDIEDEGNTEVETPVKILDKEYDAVKTGLMPEYEMDMGMGVPNWGSTDYIINDSDCIVEMEYADVKIFRNRAKILKRGKFVPKNQRTNVLIELSDATRNVNVRTSKGLLCYSKSEVRCMKQPAGLPSDEELARKQKQNNLFSRYELVKKMQKDILESDFTDKTQEECDKIKKMYANLLDEANQLVNSINQLAHNMDDEDECSDCSDKYAGKRMLILDMIAEPGGEYFIEIGYETFGISWEPYYKIDVKSDEPYATMTMFAKINNQKSDERFDNVKITLSSGINTYEYNLLEDALDTQYIKKMQDAGDAFSLYTDDFGVDKQEGMTALPANDSGERRRGHGIKEDMLEMTPVNVRENNSDILHEFELPWKMTLLPKCENEVAVWQKKIEIFKNYFAIPRKGQNEYFYVDVKGLKEYDMISGWLDIYLDSDYVRRCFLNVDKAENLKIDLGSVKGVKINSRKVADEVSSKKLQGKIIRRYKYIFEVTNNLQCTIALRLYDRIPVSQVDGVEVMLNRIDDVVLDEATGKCTWDIKVKPLSVKEIAFEYAITYPAKEKFVIE